MYNITGNAISFPTEYPQNRQSFLKHMLGSQNTTENLYQDQGQIKRQNFPNRTTVVC